MMLKNKVTGLHLAHVEVVAREVNSAGGFAKPAWVDALDEQAVDTHPIRRARTQGIRVVGLRPHGMPETRSLRDAFEPRAKASGMTWEQWQRLLASRTHARRLMTLEETANVAAFMASDQASGMTGTIVNLTMGSLDD
jgi:hypothetical protein